MVQFEITEKELLTERLLLIFQSKCRKILNLRVTMKIGNFLSECG